MLKLSAFASVPLQLPFYELSSPQLVLRYSFLTFFSDSL